MLAAGLLSGVVCLATVAGLAVWPFPVWVSVQETWTAVPVRAYGPLGFLIIGRDNYYVYAYVNWPYLVALAAISGGVAVGAIRRFVRVTRARRWIGQGRCEGCGYDLRGTPGGCPECGAGRVALADGDGSEHG